MKASGLALLAIIGLLTPLARGEELKREQDLSEKEGKPAPGLDVVGWMNTPDGKPIELEDLKGKVVVIDFWGTW
ncbi:MAG: TlpA family protein disulfide reductase [Verrucomicrobiales bacterium]